MSEFPNASRDTRMSDRDDTLARIREGIRRCIDFGPGIDPMRGAALDEAAEAALRVVEELRVLPWTAPCDTCGGSGRIACACNSHCRSSTLCPHCGGRGLLVVEPGSPASE